jgi:hypothetical protein
MIEKQEINGTAVWIRIDPQPIKRENPHIIPIEYFTATFYNNEPVNGHTNGEVITDAYGEPKLFESPVAALTHARKTLENGLTEEQGTQQTQQEQKETD